jgi:membrane-associated phospholipid phosphatase
MILPKLYSEKNKLRLLGVLSIGYACLYAFTNRLIIFEPKKLQLTSFDLFLGFSPSWIWVYLSAYIFVFVCYFLSDNQEKKNEFIYSFCFLTILSNLIFFFFPTLVSRIDFSLNEVDGLTHLAFTILRSLDQEVNCLPSLHVGTAFLGSYLFLGKNSLLFWITFLWSVLIAFSTLYTKQHIIWDAIAGFVLASFCYLLFNNKSKAY